MSRALGQLDPLFVAVFVEEADLTASAMSDETAKLVPSA